VPQTEQGYSSARRQIGGSSLRRLAIFFVAQVAFVYISPFISASDWRIAGLGRVAWAQDPQADAEETGEDSDVGTADAVHGLASDAVTASSDWLDSFFGEESYEVENNKTRLKLNFVAFAAEGRGTGYTATVGAKIALPRT
jgi:hypothetical protein